MTEDVNRPPIEETFEFGYAAGWSAAMTEVCRHPGKYITLENVSDEDGHAVVKALKRYQQRINHAC